MTTFLSFSLCLSFLSRRYKTEYRKKFRPFSLYQYVDGHFQKDSKVVQDQEHHQQQQQPQHQHQLQSADKDTWYREVIELRKKAGEYKVFIAYSNSDIK